MPRRLMGREGYAAGQRAASKSIEPQPCRTKSCHARPCHMPAGENCRALQVPHRSAWSTFSRHLAMRWSGSARMVQGQVSMAAAGELPPAP